MALKRNGMERLWRSNRVLSLHELCCHAIVARTSGYGIEKLPLPDAIKAGVQTTMTDIESIMLIVLKELMTRLIVNFLTYLKEENSLKSKCLI